MCISHRASTRYNSLLITARIRRMGEGTVFSLFVSPHLDGLEGGCPSQVWIWGGGGVPQPGLDGGGVSRPGLDG